MDHNVVEATKNICCKNFSNKAKSGRLMLPKYCKNQHTLIVLLSYCFFLSQQTKLITSVTVNTNSIKLEISFKFGFDPRSEVWGHK